MNKVELGVSLLTSRYSRAFVAGGIAACGAVTVTHSFETVKIRYVHSNHARSEFRESQLIRVICSAYNYKENCNPNPKR